MSTAAEALHAVRSGEAEVCALVESLAHAPGPQELQLVAARGLERLTRSRVAVSSRGAFTGRLRGIAAAAAVLPRSHHPRPSRTRGDRTERALLVTSAGGGLPAYLLWREQPYSRDEVGVVDSLAVALVALHLRWGATARAPLVTVPAGRASLTPRELAVLHHLARGLSADSIARLTGISPRTVRKHLQHVYAKLGAHDRLMAVERARAAGLLADGRHAAAAEL